MTKYKVGDVAALFSKPKDPTTNAGKKLQSLFEDFYSKKNKSTFQSSQEEVPELNAKTENKETQNQSMSKKKKKRKFSAVNDAELNSESNSSKKFKELSEQEDRVFKNNENKKEKFLKQWDFPRKKQKRPKVNSFNSNSSFPKSKGSTSSENNLESPTIAKLKISLKDKKQNVSFIKKSKRRSLDVGKDSSNINGNELLDGVSNKNSFDDCDASIKKEIKEFMESNSKKSKKMKNNNYDFKQNSQAKIFNWSEQGNKNIPKQKSEQVLCSTFDDNSMPKNKHESKSSPKDKQVMDFIRKPKTQSKAKIDSLGKDHSEKSEGMSKKDTFGDSDTLFKSVNEENVDAAKKFKKRKFNDNNPIQNYQTKTSEQGAPDFIKLSNSGPADDEVLSRTLFVGNLPVVTCKKELRTLFSPFGDIESVRYHGIETDKAKIFSENAPKSLNRNYASDSIPGFITFKKRESAVAALSLSGTVFKEHHITVDFALPAGTKKIYDDKRSIFIGNLPFDIKDESIWNAFMECGRIEGVRVVRDRETGIGKGFGYVLFCTVQSKENALALEDLQIGGRTIRIKTTDSNKKTQKKSDSSPVVRDTFRSRAIRFKKNNKTPNSRKSIAKLIKKEKTLHKKKKIASILQKSVKF